MKGVAAVLLLLVIAHSAVAERDPTLPCNIVSDTLLHCTEFAVGMEPEPTKECRDGVRSMGSKLKSTEGKRSGCKCLKPAVDDWPELADIVSNLFSKCGAPPPFPLTKKMDCDKIK